MIMNGQQNTRSYNPVPVDMSSQKKVSREAHVEKLKSLVKDQICHEIIHAMVLADLSSAYWKMGLEGYKHKAQCLSKMEFEENFEWRRYYEDVFDEIPNVMISYEHKDNIKSLDDIHTKMYDLICKSHENLEEILKTVEECGMYEDMELIFKAYNKSSCLKNKMESKMKRSQFFGYDVAYIMSRDKEYRHKYYEKASHEEKH